MSLLIDADWTDTACFFQNEPLKTRIPSEEMQRIWEQTTLYFENYLAAEVEGNPDNGSALNSDSAENIRNMPGCCKDRRKSVSPDGSHRCRKDAEQSAICVASCKREKEAAYFLCGSV